MGSDSGGRSLWWVLPKAAMRLTPKLVVADFGEKILVLGVGAGPAAFDVMNAQMRQFLGDADFVGQGQVEVLGLGAVSQGGVVDFYLAHGLPHAEGAQFKCAP